MNTRTRKALRWNGKRTPSRLRILACPHWAEQLSSHSVILPQCFLPEGGVITPVLVAWQDYHVNKVWWDMWICVERGFSGGHSGKEPACQCRRQKRCGFDPLVRKIPWRRAWHPTPVFLPGGFHGQSRQVFYSLWDCKELDTAKEAEHITAQRGPPIF